MGIPIDEWFPIPPSPQPRSPRPGDRDEYGLPVSGPLRPGDIGANAGGSQCDILPEAKRDAKDLCKQVAIDIGVHFATGGIPIRGLRGTRNGAASIKGGKLAYNAASKTWTSPAGLVYGHGSVHGNRVKHVLDHLVPNPSKPTHLIF